MSKKKLPKRSVKHFGWLPDLNNTSPCPFAPNIFDSRW